MGGGMGLVFLCLDRQEDHPVALKTFKPEYLSDRTARDRFLRESTTWVDLGRHPHIVRAHRVEYVSAKGEVYLVLDWVAQAENKQDASLRAWLKPSQSLPVEQALLFTLHIARGMKYATTKIPGLVHRDLKPDNVLVGRDGNAQVTDFGLAHVLLQVGREDIRQRPFRPDRTQLTQDIVGTPLYMAPEQWIPGEVLDIRADIYAVGCILYEMLTGRKAVIGRDWDELAEAHQTGRVGKLPPNLPTEVGQLVQRCLATKRENRYANWAYVEIALMQAYRHIIGRDAPDEAMIENETNAERVATGWSYYAIGYSYHEIGKYSVAKKYFERMVQFGRAEEDRRLEGAGLYYLGLVCVNLGDIQQSIHFSEQALAITQKIGDRSTEGATLCNLGNCYRNFGDMQQAIKLYEQALAVAKEIEDYPLEENILNSLGNTYRRSGQAQRAIELYKQALEIVQEMGNQGGMATILNNIGIAHRNLSNPREAIKFYEQALNISKEIGDRAGEGRALGNLGNAYSDVGDLQQTIVFSEQALVIAREIGDQRAEGIALDSLGGTHADLGNIQKAVEFCKQSLAITKTIGDTLGSANTSRNLAILLIKQGKESDALSYAEFAVQAFEQVGHAELTQKTRQLVDQIRGQSKASEHWDRGAEYANQGRWKDAIREYQKALRINPNNIVVHYNLGNVFQQQGRMEEAIREYEAALHPNFSNPYLNLGVIYGMQGRLEEAVNELKTALQINPNLEEAHLNLGIVYKQQGHWKEAINEYQAELHINPADAARIAPGYAEAHVGLGTTYAQQGRISDAIHEYQSALHLNPNNVDAHFNLAAAFATQGRVNEAIREAEIALRLGDKQAYKLLSMLRKGQ
ncbi:MAG: tetratricopeptide repeat protein [Anaerolineales bacterium]|nr:tetratricopeptide repeat protein [Anaerolineales bacterium]